MGVWDRVFDVMNNRDQVLEAIRRLPEDAKMEVICEEISFLCAVKEGMEQVESCQWIPHNELKESIPSWITK